MSVDWLSSFSNDACSAVSERSVAFRSVYWMVTSLLVEPAYRTVPRDSTWLRAIW